MKLICEMYEHLFDVCLVHVVLMIYREKEKITVCTNKVLMSKIMYCNV